MKRHTKLAWLLLAAWLPATAWALEYKSVGVPRAVIFDAPSAQAKKLFVASQYYPVEVIVNLGDWIKVRDATGDLAWIAAGDLTDQRTLLVTTETAEVHAAPDAASKLMFRVNKDVALELLESSGSWAKVRHHDGMTGYIQTSEVWGL